MVMLSGLEAGQTQENDNKQKQANYELAQSLMAKFKEENGSTICRELLAIRKDAKVIPVPDERTAEYYRQRPCLRMVESAARIWGEYIAAK